MAWDLWKKGFDTWEDRTARLLEVWLKSPLVLNGSGLLLTAVMKPARGGDKARPASGPSSACRASATRSARSTS
ncbi:MAG: hypothetical protein IPJ34_00020 [Myxococcales bacterium]|nr:hypothetical protein [Myxococcales bacterium]